MISSDLLVGPRGRRLCWHLFGNPGLVLTEQSLPAARERLPAVLAALRADDAESEARLHEPLKFSVDNARHYQPPDEIDTFLTTPEPMEVLRPVAEAIAATSVVAWWESGLALDDQRRVRFVRDEGPLPIADLDGVAERLPRQSDAWWSTPNRWDVPVTARDRPGCGPVGLWSVEDAMDWTRATVWPLRVTRPPRVYEIRGPHDWAALVRRHPLAVGDSQWWRNVTGRTGRWVRPDWSSVASEHDAVHLTVAGYLRTAGLAVPVDDGRASVLAAWAPDETYWLADDALELAGPGTDWVPADAEWRPA